MNAHFALDALNTPTAQTVAPASAVQRPLNLVAKLTRRQLEILLMLCEGKVNKQIAYDLGVSTATVKVHIRNAITRLGAKNRMNAVAIVAANSTLFRNSVLEAA
ncbi:helix-turn-helix transcriptional regulator [Roseibium sp. MMSF_3412]|uniref:helix-turn-helix domain-containing protein n=1 Tax=Roseibium sp. MMSF_3412 TaxID=3046712 RepID=UPI00273E69ED|nr:LuxR C-terminal-related transcriptional regulator [Roseibium sp. MMSF_3412]